MRRFIRKLGRSFRYGEKGFTLIELLIVVAILGILAAIVLPNVGGFLRSGNLAAANTEAAAVKTAAAAFYTANNGTWPELSTTAGFDAYLDRDLDSVYDFVTENEDLTTAGKIQSATLGWDDKGFDFIYDSQQWEPE